MAPSRGLKSASNSAARCSELQAENQKLVAELEGHKSQNKKFRANMPQLMLMVTNAQAKEASALNERNQSRANLASAEGCVKRLRMLQKW